MSAAIMSIAEVVHRFDDAAGYERFMGRWSRAVGTEFLPWMGAPTAARWLDVGCGTGVFTALILKNCAPVAVIGVDPAEAQVAHARRGADGQRAHFRVADAQSLPFPDGSFDVVASALVVNFISDRPRALAEMRRVTRPGGIIAAYVWDFAAERSPSWPLRQGMRDMDLAVPAVPGTAHSTMEALRSLFAGTSLDGIAVRVFEVAVEFPNFEDFWLAQTPSYSPTTKTIAAMTDGERGRLRDAVRCRLTFGRDGTIAYAAQANAIKARVPG